MVVGKDGLPAMVNGLSGGCNARQAQAMNRGSAHWMIIGVLVLALSACKEKLHSRVSERDANAILATLYSAGIRAGKVARDEKTWTVEVDKEDLQRALLVVREHGLPRENFSNTGELFKKEGLVSTPSEERIRFIFAVSQELANTLSQIDGVISARVHPVIPANDPLATRTRPSSASVFIKHRSNANLQAMAPAIKNLVMRGIEGLEYENIALTFVASEDPVVNAAAGMPSAAPSAQANGTYWAIGAGVLGAVLLAGVGALGYFWKTRRAAGANAEASQSGAAWPARASRWFKRKDAQRTQRADRPAKPRSSEASFSDTLTARDPT